MSRQDLIALLRSESIRLCELQLDLSAKYYGSEYASAAQQKALDEGAAAFSAAHSLQTIYGLALSRETFDVRGELAEQIKKMRGRRDAAAAILADILDRMPAEPIAA